MKLTNPQKELLAEVYNGENRVSESYRPAQRLVEFGLCEWQQGKYGGSRLNLTDAGRRYLGEQEGNEG